MCVAAATHVWISVLLLSYTFFLFFLLCFGSSLAYNTWHKTQTMKHIRLQTYRTFIYILAAKLFGNSEAFLCYCWFISLSSVIRNYSISSGFLFFFIFCILFSLRNQFFRVFKLIEFLFSTLFKRKRNELFGVWIALIVSAWNKFNF